MPVTPGHRRVELPHGRTLTVRELRDGDVPGLDRLYEGLSLADRYRRFFSVYHPPLDALDHMIHIPDGPGCGLVAVVTDADGADEIVGEATCSPLPDANGELGITIDRRWRGWLGAYLLDALVEAAAARGYPAIEADVMAENSAMLALLRGRDGMTHHPSEPGIVHVTIPTAADPDRPTT